MFHISAQRKFGSAKKKKLGVREKKNWSWYENTIERCFG
jgi:hypothetical protein